MTCNECSLAPPTPRAVKLVIKGSHIPSFKNRKRVAKGGGIFTEKKVKDRMDAIIQSFVSQLLCETATIERAMPMDSSRLSSMLSSLPADDSKKWIPEIHIYSEQVEAGNEGAEIVIEIIK